MKRNVIMVLLGLGVVVGYGSGIAQIAHCHHWREQHRQELMSEFARACVDAQQKAGSVQVPTATQPAAPQTH